MRSWLAQKRKEIGLTMKQMGDALDISESYYCLIENGERQKNMEITIVTKLSSILSIPVEDIIENELKGATK